MAYAIPSFVTKPPIKGIRYDLPPSEIPRDAARMLVNFVRRSGIVQSRPGYATMGSSVSERPTGMVLFQHHSGNSKLVMATEGGWFDWSGSTWTDRTLSGSELNGTNDSFNLFRIFYKSNVSYLVGVNGHTDSPKKWNGTDDDYANVGGSPGNAKCIGVLANRMLLANFANAPVQVDVSGFNDFETGWGTTQLVNLYETGGEIMAIQERGNLVATIYKTDAIYSCIAAPALAPFKFELKKAGISGPLSPASVVTAPWGLDYIFARDFNVYIWDGSNYAPLGDHVRSLVSDHINKDKAHRSWGFFNEAENEIWFFFPSAGVSDLPDSAVVIKQDGTAWLQTFSVYITAGAQVGYTNKVVIGDLTGTLGSYTNPLSSYVSYQQFQVLGSSTGQVYQEQGNLDFGSPMYVEYLSGMYSPSEKINPVTIGEVTFFTWKTPGSQTVYVALTYSQDGSLNPKTGSYQTINLGEDGPQVLGERLTSRFFGLSVYANCNERVELEAIKVSGIERGLR